MSEYSYVKKFTVDPLMVDCNLRLFPAALYRCLQLTADEHVNRLKFEGDDMGGHRYSWVLTRNELFIDRYPVFKEPFEIYTATCEVRHGVYPRYFEIRDNQGQKIGHCMSMWVVFDLEKRCMVAESESGIRVGAELSAAEMPKLPSAPRPLKEGESKIAKRTVAYSDLDLLNHMNNTKYVDWLCDMVEIEKFKDHIISHMIINYAEESRPGTELTLELKEKDNSFSFRDLSEGKSHFVIQGEYKAI